MCHECIMTFSIVKNGKIMPTEDRRSKIPDHIGMHELLCTSKPCGYEALLHERHAGGFWARISPATHHNGNEAITATASKRPHSLGVTRGILLPWMEQSNRHAPLARFYRIILQCSLLGTDRSNEDLVLKVLYRTEQMSSTRGSKFGILLRHRSRLRFEVPLKNNPVRKRHHRGLVHNAFTMGFRV